MKQEILNEENAVRETLKELSKLSYKWRNLHYINKNRYCIVTGRDGSPNIAILLKTEPFYNFGKKFNEKGMKGVGDSINVEHIKEFNQYNVKFVYTKFRDGKLYFISLEEILSKSYEWIQKEGTLVRSFSIHLYQRVNDE